MTSKMLKLTIMATALLLLPGGDRVAVAQDDGAGTDPYCATEAEAEMLRLSPLLRSG